MNIDLIKNEIDIPSYVVNKMQELGITEMPRIRNLVGEYMTEAGTIMVDWYYFNQWVAMDIVITESNPAPTGGAGN